MTARPRTAHTSIPLDGLVFGYGPMAPLALAAVGVWAAPALSALAVGLAIIWGAIILVFTAGVRRGYGFGDPEASTAREIAAMLAYFTTGGVALVLAGAGAPSAALALLVLGFGLAAVLDRAAGRTGDAPDYFVRLRGPQMSIAAISLALVLAHGLLSAPR